MAETQVPLLIGALSKRTGCNIETIRYYERIGLLPAPARSGGGYRVYGLADLKRLHFIRRAREIGFGLDEVRRLLELADDRIRSCRQARQLGSAHLAEVKTKIARLRRVERVLAEMVARCDDGRVPACPLIDALFERGPPADAPRRPPAAKSRPGQRRRST